MPGGWNSRSLAYARKTEPTCFKNLEETIEKRYCTPKTVDGTRSMATQVAWPKCPNLTRAQPESRPVEPLLLQRIIVQRERHFQQAAGHGFHLLVAQFGGRVFD